jgi:hypothetical protein
MPSRSLDFNHEVRDAINGSTCLLLMIGPYSALGGVDATGTRSEPRTYCIAISSIWRRGDYYTVEEWSWFASSFFKWFSFGDLTLLEIDPLS